MEEASARNILTLVRCATLTAAPVAARLDVDHWSPDWCAVRVMAHPIAMSASVSGAATAGLNRCTADGLTPACPCERRARAGRLRNRSWCDGREKSAGWQPEGVREQVPRSRSSAAAFRAMLSDTDVDSVGMRLRAFLEHMLPRDSYTTRHLTLPQGPEPVASLTFTGPPMSCRTAPTGGFGIPSWRRRRAAPR